VRQGAGTSVRGASSFRPQTGIQNQLCALVADLSLSPVFHNLTLHQLEVPLNPFDADGKAVDQIEAPRMLRQDRRKHS